MKNAAACLCLMNYLAPLRSVAGTNESRHVRKYDPTSAYSQVSDRRRSHGAYLSPLGAKNACTDAPN
jgi:hypothetical protein